MSSRVSAYSIIVPRSDDTEEKGGDAREKDPAVGLVLARKTKPRENVTHVFLGGCMRASEEDACSSLVHLAVCDHGKRGSRKPRRRRRREAAETGGQCSLLFYRSRVSTLHSLDIYLFLVSCSSVRCETDDTEASI